MPFTMESSWTQLGCPPESSQYSLLSHGNPTRKRGREEHVAPGDERPRKCLYGAEIPTFNGNSTFSDMDVDMGAGDPANSAEQALLVDDDPEVVHLDAAKVYEDMRELEWKKAHADAAADGLSSNLDESNSLACCHQRMTGSPWSQAYFWRDTCTIAKGMASGVRFPADFLTRTGRGDFQAAGFDAMALSLGRPQHPLALTYSSSQEPLVTIHAKDGNTWPTLEEAPINNPQCVISVDDMDSSEGSEGTSTDGQQTKLGWTSSHNSGLAIPGATSCSRLPTVCRPPWEACRS